jgi:hypothetical protein
MCFRGKLPRWVLAVLAIVQIVLTAAIAGLEFGSFYYDIAHGTIWAGFWSALVYIITFIMMFCMSMYFAILVPTITVFFYLFSLLLSRYIHCYLYSNTQLYVNIKFSSIYCSLICFLVSNECSTGLCNHLFRFILHQQSLQMLFR